MNKLRLAMLMLLACGILLNVPGCAKEKDDEKGEAAETTLKEVTAEQRAAADAAIKKLWADKDLVAGVAHYKPSDEEKNYYRDLVVLTRHGHRLAGYGAPNLVDNEGKAIHVAGDVFEVDGFVTDANGNVIDGKVIEGMQDHSGSLFAGEYVANRLMAMGVKFVVTQKTPVSQSVNTESELTVDGKTYGPGDGFHVMQPNHLQGVVTPAEGLTGDTLYVAGGKIEEYSALGEGRIVVLDFSAGDRWLPAFAQGAKAVIFIGSDEPAALPHHHLNFLANLPRFYATRELADKLKLTESKTVTVKAACKWRRLEDRNVIAIIPGTNPKFKDADGKVKAKGESIVLAAPLDSLSETPILSPGARGAANCAALLKLAEYYQDEKNRPRRDIVLAFLGGEASNHAGARQFYGSLYRDRAKDKVDPIEDRLEMLGDDEEGEGYYLSSIAEVLEEAVSQLEKREAERAASPDIDKENEHGDELKGLDGYGDAGWYLKGEAKSLSGDIKDRLYLLRMTKNHRERQIAPRVKKRGLLAEEAAKQGATSKPETTKALAELDAEIKPHRDAIAAMIEEVAQLEAFDQVSWGKVERALNKQQYPVEADDEEIANRLASYRDVVEKVQEDYLPAERKEEILEKFEKELNKRWRPYFRRAAIVNYETLLTKTRKVVQGRQVERRRLVAYAQRSKMLLGKLGPKKTRIVLHLSINLGDEAGRWAFIHGNDSRGVTKGKDNPGQYAGSVFRVIRNLAGASSNAERWPLFESRTVEGIGAARRYASGRFAHSGAVAGIFGVPNLSIMTSLGRRVRDGQPCDTLWRLGADGEREDVLDVANMTKPLGEIAQVVGELANAEKMTSGSNIDPQIFYTEAEFKNGRYSGGRLQMQSGASATADRPARGAFVAILRKPGKVWEGARIDKTPPGFRPFCIVPADANGRFEAPPLAKGYYAEKLIVGAICDERGLIEYVSNQATSQSSEALLEKVSTILFRSVGVTMVGFGYNRGAVGTTALKADSTAPLNAGRSLVAESRNVLSVYLRQPAYRLKLFNKEGMVVLGNARTDLLDVDPVVGVGREISPFEHWPTYRMTPTDLGALTKARQDMLKSHDIEEASLVGLEVAGRETREAAMALPDTDVQHKMGRLAGSSAIFRSLYNPQLSVLNDLVLAVVLLMLLTIPFAYAVERLLIGTPHIYRQISWFTLFFLITFAILFIVNPAFSIAATPIIIFLAFAIILLSALVIIIMTRKLQAEVGRMQGLGTSVHSSDVSRLGTMLAAVHMGISTMRRRPIRTLLTAVTVILLTFTILTFASFSSSYGALRTYEGPLVGKPRLLIRHPLWSRLDEQTLETLTGYLKKDATVVPRYWVSLTAGEEQQYENANRTKEVVLADSAREQVYPISALMGVDYRDLDHLPQLRDTLEGDLNLLKEGEMGVFITRALAGPHGLKLERGDKIIVDGYDCVVAGFVVGKKMQTYRMLEGSEPLPVDYQASGGGSAAGFQAQENASLDDLADVESAAFVRFDRDAVAIVSASLARKLEGRIASIAIYPNEGADIEEMADTVATMTRLPTYVGAKGGVHRLLFTSLTEASGWKDLLMPVILGGLIIFATMLGSVSDREKEIYAFSALGLAPPHIASLFFAEAGVYSVIGGMGGYLIGQTIARSMGFFTETLGLDVDLTMNYSSMNAIVTVMIVMGTVLISTIYPAIKASRSANPGIQRSWKIPKPVDDLYNIVFPFTVSAYDITGVVSFLKEHFENFSDTALGVFATASVHAFRTEEDMLGLQAEVALAPFDLGVSQKFALIAQPSEIEGIEEIRILLRRISGTRGDWRRANRVFVNELRKQLLIWRSVSPEITEKYRQRTIEQWRDLPIEDVRPETFGGQA